MEPNQELNQEPNQSPDQPQATNPAPQTADLSSIYPEPTKNTTPDPSTPSDSTVPPSEPASKASKKSFSAPIKTVVAVVVVLVIAGAILSFTPLLTHLKKSTSIYDVVGISETKSPYSNGDFYTTDGKTYSEDCKECVETCRKSYSINGVVIDEESKGLKECISNKCWRSQFVELRKEGEKVNELDQIIEILGKPNLIDQDKRTDDTFAKEQYYAALLYWKLDNGYLSLRVTKTGSNEDIDPLKDEYFTVYPLEFGENNLPYHNKTKSTDTYQDDQIFGTLDIN